MAYSYNQPNPTNYNQLNNQQIIQQNVQPYFPSPQGNVYTINSTLEVANVPVGAGMSIALCLPENCMYIKTLQNGNPMFYPYKLVPFTCETKEEEKKEDDTIEQLTKRIQSLEEQLKAPKQTTKGSEW